MQITISGRHMDVTSALKAYVENSIQKLCRHFDRVLDVNVALSVEKHRHIAEVNLHANGLRIHGKAMTDDMYASIDAVMDKLEKQIQKYKDRINRHKPRSIKELPVYEHAVINVAGGNGQERAIEEAETPPRHEIVHREKLTMKPMSVDEAIMQFELIDDPFLVFYNVNTSQVNVLYQRDDGTYGLIEPQF
jgi:putative sigma-54 modulation protein